MAYKVKTAEARKRGNQAQVAQVLVEGKYMTYKAIGDKLGISRDEANRRYKSLRLKGRWPILLGDMK